MPIKRCFCSIAFRQEAIEDIIPLIADAGFDGIEIFGGHIDGKSDAALRSLKKLAEQQQLDIEVLSPYFWLTNSQALHDESLERAQRFAHYADLLGCPKIRTFTDAGPTGVGSDVASNADWQTAVSALQQICDYAPHLLFCVELHQKTLADSIPSAQQLLQRVKRDNLKLIYHTPGWNLIGDFDLVQDQVRHIHLHNTGNETMPGFLDIGDCDLPGFLKHISERGYQDSLSVEYCFSGSTHAHPAAAMKYLRQHMHQHAAQ